MKIYTKTGDDGSTSLIGGTRVRKDVPQVEAYGTLDELIAQLGLLRVFLREENEDIEKEILSIQQILFQLGAVLSSDFIQKSNYSTEVIELNGKITWMEERIDQMQKELTPIKEFVIPGSDLKSTLCHVCRTVCRRLERRILGVENLPKEVKNINIFINRLSDYLFVVARKIQNKT
jgi:cob(I)alamin adenosyltransferase